MIDSIVKREMVVVDIGASAGDFTARLAFKVGRRGLVHCFEPNPTHRERLERLARRPQIVFHRVALSDHGGRAELHVPVIRKRPQHGLATLRRVDAGVSVEVGVDTLDHRIDFGRPVDFVKCDVEGHEYAVLKGGERTIREWMPTLLMEIEQRHVDGLGIERVFRLLDEWGYRGEALFPEGLRPIAEFNLERDQLAFVESNQDAMPAGYVNTFLFVGRRELG